MIGLQSSYAGLFYGIKSDQNYSTRAQTEPEFYYPNRSKCTITHISCPVPVNLLLVCGEDSVAPVAELNSNLKCHRTGELLGMTLDQSEKLGRS